MLMQLGWEQLAGQENPEPDLSGLSVPPSPVLGYFFQAVEAGGLPR